MTSFHGDAVVAGRGSYGVVVRAKSPLGGAADVAIKLFKSSSTRSSASRLRATFRSGVFTAEASRLLAVRRHPNVVRALGVLEDPLAIVMEYVAGGSLYAWIQRLSADRDALATCRHRLLSIAIDICRAMAHIHAAGLVHCDLKLGNVLVTEDSIATVSDLGCAKAVDDMGDECGSHVVWHPHVDSGSGIRRTTGGTHGHMPPEQLVLLQDADGRVREYISQRSDVWSFGVLLLQLLQVNSTLTSVRHVAVQTENILSGRQCAFGGLTCGTIGWSRGVPTETWHHQVVDLGRAFVTLFDNESQSDRARRPWTDAEWRQVVATIPVAWMAVPSELRSVFS